MVCRCCTHIVLHRHNVSWRPVPKWQILGWRIRSTIPMLDGETWLYLRVDSIPIRLPELRTWYDMIHWFWTDDSVLESFARKVQLKPSLGRPNSEEPRTSSSVFGTASTWGVFEWWEPLYKRLQERDVSENGYFNGFSDKTIPLPCRNPW